jgi:hypothetical protein
MLIRVRHRYTSKLALMLRDGWSAGCALLAIEDLARSSDTR